MSTIGWPDRQTVLQKWYGSFTIQRLELRGSYGLGRDMCHRSYGLDTYMTACKGPCCTSRNTCGASPTVQWQKYDSLARSRWSRTDGLAITSSARSTWSRTDGLARSTWRRIDGLARSNVDLPDIASLRPVPDTDPLHLLSFQRQPALRVPWITRRTH
jgi:hypothetical protein